MCRCTSRAATSISRGEAIGAHRRGELGSQHLDGHLAVVSKILGEVDRGHAALAQLALEAVPVREGVLKQVRQVWQRLVSEGGAL